MKLNTFWGLKGYGENSTINDTLAISNFNKSLQYESNLGERKKKLIN